MKRRAGLVDVAKAAGVSSGTVSNVLNNPERVRQVTRERVYRAMRELGYRPAGITVPADRIIYSPEPKTTMPLFVSAGYISVDLIARVGVMPHRDDRITAERISKQLGGPAANVAVAAAALGPPFELDVELATAIGQDADSLWALECLSERGVRAKAVRSPFKNRLSRCIVLVENSGHRTKVNEPFEMTEDDLISHLPIERLKRRSHLHFEGYQADAILPALPTLRGRGWTTSVHDTGLPEKYCTPDGFARLVDLVDTVLINRRMAYRVLGHELPFERLIQEMAVFLDQRRAGSEVVITLGPNGAAVFSGHPVYSPVLVPAPSVKIVDGTGAGDCFVGAYLGQRICNETMELSAARACIAASRVMTAEGAQGCQTSVRSMTERQRVAFGAAH